jgi:hypothetical protein
VKLISELAIVKVELSDVKKQLANELKQVHTWLDEISVSGAIAAFTALTSPNPSYVNVACLALNSLPMNVNSILSMGTTSSIMMDTLFCILDISYVVEGENNKTTISVIRLIIEKEICAVNG